MAIGQHSEHGEEWRLGTELGDHQEHEIVERPAAARDLSSERLGRPLQVVTVEHLGWVAIAVYATLTRLIALGARPLNGVEADHALYELELTNTGAHAATFHPAYSGWIHLLTAATFVLGGANDFTARIVFALSGLVLIAMAFALRHNIGRAGGLALGAMLTLSPSVIAFSRASATATPAAAMAIVTIAAFMAVKSRPAAVRAAALGLFAGLTIAANRAGFATVLLMVAALFPIGLWNLVTRKDVMLAIRVWLVRYRSYALLVIAVAAVVWVLSQMVIAGGLRTREILAPVGQASQIGFDKGIGGTIARFVTGFIAGLRRGAGFYLPVLALYEFMIALAGIFGAIVIIGGKVRSRFATWALIWMALSVAYFLWSPRHDGGTILFILMPAGLVGAIGVDRLHQSDGWRIARWPIAAIAALTLYVGAIANFVYDAPDASKAPWARHANLFWGASATTEQTRLYSRQAASGLAPADATVFFDDEAREIGPPVRWYLRELRPTATAEAATVVVSSGVPLANPDQTAATYHFDYAEGWRANFTGVRPDAVIRFLLSGRIWGPVTSDAITIQVRKPIASAPTVILTPDR